MPYTVLVTKNTGQQQINENRRYKISREIIEFCKKI